MSYSDLTEITIPTVSDQIERDDQALTWKEYASYLFQHEDMEFTAAQCMLIAGRSLSNLEVVDLVDETEYSYEELTEERENIDFGCQLSSRKAELEVFETIVPASSARCVGRVEYFGTPEYMVFLSVDSSPYVSVSRRETTTISTNDDALAFYTAKKTEEFNVYTDFESFYSTAAVSPNNTPENDPPTVCVEGPLYDEPIEVNL